MSVDDKGFVTARAVVVPFRPEHGHPLAYNVAEGGGRYVAFAEDARKLQAYDCVTVRFWPYDQFARLFTEDLKPLPWEVDRGV